MDSSELIELVLKTLPWVGGQAIYSGIETGDVKAGVLGTELYLVASEISSLGSQICDRRLKQLMELLQLVNKACSMSYPNYKVNKPSIWLMLRTLNSKAQIHKSAKKSRSLATLREIAETRTTGRASRMVELEEKIQLSLRCFFADSPEVPTLLKIIAEFVPTRVNESPDQKADNDTIQLENNLEYLRHANNVLYSHLRMQISCSCRTRHLEKARLRLESENVNLDEEAVRFELLFRASLTPPDHDFDNDSVLWQEMDVFVPREKNDGYQRNSNKPRKIRFKDEHRYALSSVAPHSREMLKTLGPGELCRSVTQKIGSRLSFQIHQGALKLLETRGDLPKRNVKLVEGISLAQLLDEASYMPKRVKIVLAYTIAKSVWQYYNSHWMINPWTHENIYFLEENNLGQTDYKPHPYFAVNFNKSQNQILDFYTGQHLMFNYPDILALAILLIEIATGRCFKDIDASCRWGGEQINTYFTQAWETAAENDLGNKLYKSYADVVNSCLDRGLFEDAPFNETKPEMNLEARQSILYNKVVLPLEGLVNAYRNDWELREIYKQPNTKGWHGGEKTSKQTIPCSEGEPDMIIRDPVFLASEVAGTGRWTPEYWLRQIDKINQGLTYLAQKSPTTTSIKIAILDTGCDMDAEYFSTFPDDEERLEGHWKDWVDNEPSPVDQHGHGTALVILLMRMVRNAEIFVARIARNAKGLQHAEDTVAKAIIYAAEQWNVDIISMSFGFSTEVESIRNAIRKAEDIKNMSIVFFAAAANDGANRQEMFPASMESVISVRATNSNGSFVPAYDPPPSAMNEDNRLFGTLGENVPYDWSNEKLIKSGCSLATPIMAGITTLIMEYYMYKASSFKRSEHIQEHIKTKRGIVQLFKEIAVKKGNQRSYIAPWEFFEKEEENRLSTVRTAIGKLPRQKS